MVDDVASHARVTAIGLRIEGFEVEVAPDSEGALRVLAEQAFDVAMVDLMMPGTNGMQLCRMIREKYPETRVVLTSTYHLSERQLLRADCGAVGFGRVVSVETRLKPPGSVRDVGEAGQNGRGSRG